MQLYKQKEEQQVELIDRILESENIEAAIRAVERNQGAPGIDKKPVGILEHTFRSTEERSGKKFVRRSMSRRRYGGYTSRKQTESNGRWESRR